MTPVRVVISSLPDGAVKVEVRCGCIRLARVITSWEPTDETIKELREEHARRAPLCRHVWTSTTPEASLARGVEDRRRSHDPRRRPDQPAGPSKHRGA